MARDIEIGDSHIDGRSLMKRVEELESEIEALEEESEDSETTPARLEAIPKEMEEARETLAPLKELWAGIGEDMHASLIHEGAWEAYARDMALELYEGLGDIPRAWIDWEIVARDMAADYDSADAGGESYYVSR